MPPPAETDRSFKIRPSNDGITLSAALRKFLGEAVSWSEIKRLIATRKVHLNGNLCLDEARKVKAGDTVHLFAHSRAPLPTEHDIIIRHLDEHLVVIEKPPGLNTLRHREESDIPQQRKDKAPTVDELLQKLINQKYREGHFRSSTPSPRFNPNTPNSKRSSAPPPHPLFGKPKHPPRTPNAERRTPNAPPPTRNLTAPPTLRPVHRLDRETSGLMLFALSAAAEQSLERDFARHIVLRKYLAIVHGHLAHPRTIDTYLLRDRGDGIRGSSPTGHNGPARPPADAQHAITHVTPLEQIGPFSTVECQLKTGRTHQIRIHLSEIGHPLAGEKTYLTPQLTASPTPPPARHALHSHYLRFTHPATGALLEFSSPLPKDLATWLKKVRPPPDR